MTCTCTAVADFERGWTVQHCSYHLGLEKRIEELEAKLHNAICDKHFHPAGRYARCLVCGLEDQHAALSRICYLTELPNEMECSTYDVFPSAPMVVDKVQQRIATLEAQRDELREALRALISFPRVRDLLAPSGSLGSIVDQVNAAFERSEAK